MSYTAGHGRDSDLELLVLYNHWIDTLDKSLVRMYAVAYHTCIASFPGQCLRMYCYMYYGLIPRPMLKNVLLHVWPHSQANA